MSPANARTDKPLKYQDLEDICLYRFYGLIWGKSSFVRVNNFDLKKVRPGDISLHVVTQMMEALRKKGFLIAKSVAGQPIFGISKKGIEHIDKQLEKPESAVSRYRDEGDILLGAPNAETPTGSATESASQLDNALAKFEASTAVDGPLDELDLSVEADLGAVAEDDDGPTLELDPEIAAPAPAPAAPAPPPTATNPQPERSYGWDEPDGAGTLPGPKVTEIQTLIRELIVTVDSGRYSERDRLQISGRIVAVRQLASMPMPPWNLIIETLKPLESLQEFALRIRKIRDFVAGQA